MIIAGLKKTSIIDYPGKIAAVVFTYGCNFRCPFCHNPGIVIGKKNKDFKPVKEDDFFEFLVKRKSVLEGVVVTGGEPLLNNNIIQFIKKIKKLNFSVKLDTNGTNPDFLQKLIDQKLIDFIAMDIKNSFEKYEETVGVNVNLDDIKKSIGIIKKSKLPYEFRSTVLPRLHTKEDFKKMASILKGSRNFYIQGFRSDITLDPSFTKERGFSSKDLNDIKSIFNSYVDKCYIRNNT